MNPPAAEAQLHRLTVLQYQNSIRDLFGEDLEVPTDLEPDSKLHGYTSVATGELTISPIAARKSRDLPRHSARLLCATVSAE